jgi:hypothetical protein
MAEPNVMTRLCRYTGHIDHVEKKILRRYQLICTINDHALTVHVPPMCGKKNLAFSQVTLLLVQICTHCNVIMTIALMVDYV